MEDIQRLRHDPCIGGRERIPSPDTVGRALQSLSEENTPVENPRTGRSFLHNFGEKLNDLLVDVALLLDTLPKGPLTLDFDHEFTPTEKYDTVRCYKHERGYFPGVATIGDRIVGVENRAANASPVFAQDQQLERIFQRLKRNNIVIENFRADNASYCQDTLRVVMAHTKYFYVRARSPKQSYNLDSPDIQWNTVEINDKKVELASIEAEFVKGHTHRLVVKREEQPLQDPPMKDLFGPRYKYRAIITNNFTLSDKEVLEFYNARGASERLFDVMNNDFGWANQPFSFMEQNTAYLIVKAIIHHFYHYLLKRISPHVPALPQSSRMKKFIYHFVSVPAKWARTARQWVLNLYTEQSFYLVLYKT